MQIVHTFCEHKIFICINSLDLLSSVSVRKEGNNDMHGCHLAHFMYFTTTQVLAVYKSTIVGTNNSTKICKPWLKVS